MTRETTITLSDEAVEAAANAYIRESGAREGLPVDLGDFDPESREDALWEAGCAAAAALAVEGPRIRAEVRQEAFIEVRDGIRLRRIVKPEKESDRAYNAGLSHALNAVVKPLIEEATE